VAGTDVSGLHGLEVLEGTEFVGHCGLIVPIGSVLCQEIILWFGEVGWILYQDRDSRIDATDHVI
jgi:hypothetical protein